MPKKSSTNQEPEKLEASTSIPDPSPVIDLDKSQAWEKKKDTARGTTQAPPESAAGKPGDEEPQQKPTREETTWAVISHLSVLLNLVTGFLGGIAALVIYFVYKDRSRYVAYHALQSFIFQTITWLGGGLISGFLITFGGALSFLIIPLLCLIPGFLILLLIPISLIYGVIGAVQVSNNGNFTYWLVGDWVLGMMTPKRK
ncbi:MAG TPA: hypothetical protein DF984_05320 [Anaerolineaceae bacterium]|jgi:uncharacterized Tic20 family protein|nr:hypothetical protein [Anaerolineaceae bacterium]